MKHHPKKLDHMKDRYKQLGSLKELGEEFNMSKSNAHRLVNKESQSEVDCYRKK